MSATRRARKKARTRDALQDAALRLFAEHGYQNTTVDDIAAAADVSRRTFFRYFETKESVVFPHYRRRLQLFSRLVAERHPGETRLGAVRRALIAIAHEYMERPLQVLRQQEIINESPPLMAKELTLDREWEALIAATLMPPPEHGTPEAQRRARMLAGAIIGVVRVTLREWFDTGGEADLVTIGLEALDLVAQGAGTVDPERATAT